MPEQNEWTNGTQYNPQYNPDFGVAERTPVHADSGDYTWPAPAYDVRTPDIRTQSAISNLQSALAQLTNEVEHLREDIARIARGESAL